MALSALEPSPGSERTGRASLAMGAVAGCALLALVDPAEGGVYPTCPTRAVLGIDCPACGTLRGLHALARGNVGAALDHNLLLVLAVPIGAIIWWRWVRAAIGRQTRPVALPRWAPAALIAVAAVFAIVRNLPISGLAWLDSAA